jgi:hypothetical protein
VDVVVVVAAGVGATTGDGPSRARQQRVAVGVEERPGDLGVPVATARGDGVTITRWEADIDRGEGAPSVDGKAVSTVLPAQSATERVAPFQPSPKESSMWMS